MRRLLALALVALLGGCQLIADFDRSRIPEPTPDAGPPDAGPAEVDAGPPDAGTQDAGPRDPDGGASDAG